MNFNIEDINLRISNAKSTNELNSIEKEFLARENGKITLALQNLGKLSPDERKSLGAELNKLKGAILQSIKTQEKIILDNEILEKIKNEKIDVTAPANYHSYNKNIGSTHIISETKNLLMSILSKYKFAIYSGDYDIETSYHNFTSLNTDQLHPARQSQDSIYIDSNSIIDDIKNNNDYFSKEENDEFLLRTHTSAQQVRIAKDIIAKHKIQNPESNHYNFKYATMGRTYRNESDGTHSPMFHQVELVAVSKNIFPQDLINMILILLSEFFEIKQEDLKINLRSNYFPFTMPSWEVDLFLPARNSWVEILGAGMIHESVIKNMGLDPSIYKGYAMGAGLERLAMLKNNIQNLRQFFGSNIEWLKYYSQN